MGAVRTMRLLGGKHAVVTGGASGIGLAVCRRFADEGAKVTVIDVDGDGGNRAASDVGGFAYEADVCDAEAMRRVMREAADRMGGLSILVNNAGVGNLAPLEKHDAEAWDRIVRVNLTGVFNCLKAALPLLRAGGGGSVVNNSSGSGPRPTRYELPYSAAKAGVIALTQGAAQEWGPEIRVNCVSPGVIRTPLTEPLFEMPGVLEPVIRSTPLARTGTAEEVADVILFLASDLSRFVTGQNLVVDGGMALPQAGIDEVLKGLIPPARDRAKR
jgi:NAD(P)-dependent dehydrogenase (short-subunit alcohol dehydrogenase family)